MLVLRFLRPSLKLSFLRRFSRPNGLISQNLQKVSLWSLSNCHSSRSCLPTRTNFVLQQLSPISLSLSRFSNNQDSKLSKFVGQHEVDKVSEDFELIYSNSIIRYYQLVYYFLNPISLLGMVSSVSLIWTNYEDFFLNSISMGDHPFTAGCIFFLASSAMMYIFVDLCQRALVRIYFNPQNGRYVAIKFPWKQQIAFTQNDVQVRGTDHILPFHRNNIEVKGKPFLMMNRDFIDIGRYNNFIGGKHQNLLDNDD